MTTRVLIRCPRTGAPLDTGVTMDARLLERFQPRNARVFCPFCRTSHQWRPGMAYLEGEESPDRRTG